MNGTMQSFAFPVPLLSPHLAALATLSVLLFTPQKSICFQKQHENSLLLNTIDFKYQKGLFVGLLRRCSAWWCGGGGGLFLFFCFNLLKSVLHYRKHLCLGAPHSALERPWSAAELLWLADQDWVQKSPRFTLL